MLRSIFLAPISLAMLTQMSAGIFGKVSGKNFWPPKPGLTVITRMTSQSRAFGDVAGGQHQPTARGFLSLRVNSSSPPAPTPPSPDSTLTALALRS